MKTSIKNYSRFIGIVVVMMVLSLINGNLIAQKSYNENKLASLSIDFFTNSKNEIIHAISDLNVYFTEKTEEPVEEWMSSPLEWNEESSFVLEEEVNFEDHELILEDWMMETNWIDTNAIEEELVIEDWMTQPLYWDSSK